MGQVINVSEAGIDYVLYGDKSNIVSNYLYNQMQAIPQVFNDFGRKVYDGLVTSYNYVNDQLTKYGILNEIKNNGINIIDNYYSSIYNFTDLQNANVLMQRWIMANPNVRTLYLNQDIDGYSSTYQNTFGKDIGEADYNYRRVMNGVLAENDTSGYVKHYYEDLLPGDKELNHFEKIQVLDTWNCIDWLLETSSFDFTCKSKTPVTINRP